MLGITGGRAIKMFVQKLEKCQRRFTMIVDVVHVVSHQIAHFSHLRGVIRAQQGPGHECGQQKEADKGLHRHDIKAIHFVDNFTKYECEFIGSRWVSYELCSRRSHGTNANLHTGWRTRHEIRQFIDNWTSHLQFFVQFVCRPQAGTSREFVRVHIQ